MRPGQSAEREKLPISTLFDVLNLLPNIHGLHLERCALCILSDPHDHQQHPPLVFPKRAVYDLQTLTFHGIIGKTAIQAITVLLSRFKYIGSLTFAGIHTTRWPLDSPLSFLFPLDGLAIESLTLEHQSMDPDSEVDGSEEVMQVLCHELQAHADLGALRELVVDVLTTELLDLASAAPHLEHINCVATSTAPPVDSARHRVALRRLTLVVPVLLRGDLGLYGASPLADLAAHLRALAVFGAAEIAICVHLCMLPSEPGEDELDVDVAVQFTLNMLEPEWHEVGEALGYYASLRMLTLEVRNMTYMPDQAYDTLLGAAAAHNLPVKYADMLRLV
ncbi:hypothetical protein PsYK624_167400 [Phanerochaete sordida]|uniref:Uncharacterized protein n=1 Tax=Phanerochaete sordida TaxID=48140 RepID=A0A9P3LMD3_9APHY|nr:hypothetical protein PsYK624_167400 [Phanerochaete sordida]